MNVNDLNLDVSKQPAVTPVLYLGQGDKNGTTLRASIYDDGAQLSLSGKSVRFAMRSPNGQAYYEVNGTVSGNVATFQINEEYAARIAGTTDVAYVEVLEGSTVVCSTNRFRVVILESAQEGADPEQAYSNGIFEAIDDAHEAADDARDAAEEAREAAGGTVPLMTATRRGGAKLGAGLMVGSDEKLGVKVDGSTITIGQDGMLHGNASITVDSALSDTSTNPVQNKVVKAALDGKAANSDATTTAHGLMSAADKAKLDGIEANANNYSLPTMSPTTKGGAKLGKGLSMDGESLNLGPLTDSGSGASVQTDGCGIFGVTGEGFAHQDGTPTPDSPQEIRVARGRNLLPITATSQTVNGVTFAINHDGSITVNGTASSRIDFPITSRISVPDGIYFLSGCPSNGSYGTHGLSIKFGDGPNATYYSEYGSGQLISRSSSMTAFAYISIEVGYTCSNLNFYPQLELGTQATPYVPYGHMGLDVQGKNLIPPMYYRTNSTDFVADESQPHEHRMRTSSFAVSANTVYTVSGMPSGTRLIGVRCFNSVQQNLGDASISGLNITTLTNAAYMFILFGDDNNTYTVDTKQVFIDSVQLEAGSTATSYEPYHHTTTPISLPAKGFAGALPDGTADTLSIDSAGRVEWVNATNENTAKAAVSVDNGNQITLEDVPESKQVQDNASIFSGYSNIGIITANQAWNGIAEGAAFNTNKTMLAHVDGVTTKAEADSWLASNPVTVLYPLATQTTESSYIQLPELPAGATVSIPELEAIGVEWWVEGAEAMAEHGRDTSKAAHELSEKLSTLEAAVATLATS